ncbi:MAG: response regulator [Labilithrix sp.]|nr:response regulator [Labilithrix sp.]
MSASPDPFKYFRVEAREIVDELGRGVLLLEKDPTPALAARLLRLAHTLKGAARVVKQRAVAERAHTIEEALGPLRTPGAALGRDVVQSVLGLIDSIAADVKALDPAPPQRAPAGAEPIRTVRADLADVDGLLDGLAEISIEVRSLKRALGSLEMVQRLDRVEAELLELRGAAERLRLVSVGAMFTALERVAHDAAEATQRRVSLVTRGDDIRVDADVLGSVQSALVQLVRNAVAHGIEASSERVRLGKPAEGRIEVSAVRHGRRVVFACRDDGAGFDLEAVRRVAVRRGLTAGAVTAMKEGDLLELLLRGGLTTFDRVTEVAGRGIGLDVVRDVAAVLGGEVRVDNQAGRGASVELSVPVALAAIDALIVEAGGVAAAVPLGAVRETLRVSEADVARTARGESISSQGEMIPLMTLARSFGDEGSRGGAVSSVVVIEDGETAAAMRVDRLLATASVVVRPLPRTARTGPMVVGAAFDAEGVPQLVLDPASLVALAARGQSAPVTRPREQALPILVIDDSLTTRRLEQSILESAGYEVDLATSAEEGLVKARARRYQLFLVDVEMPGMNGFEFIEQTKIDPTLRDTPAILVTSRSGSEERRRAKEVGARAFIVKGEFDQQVLLDEIRGLRS